MNGRLLGIMLAALAVTTMSGGQTVSGQEQSPLAPFVLPWDDASEGITNISGWLAGPAGQDGPVVARDGHLYVGSRRIRFFGVNLCFGACFPRHADAEKVAARLARFGVNCVRFHHMDTSASPNGLLKADMATFDADQLDRLDYLIAQLRKHGIYVNLNLHVGRMYPGLARWEGMPGYFKGIDNFHPRMIQLQRDYARELLAHVNPYTKASYAAEPAVAFVEINNENGLIHEWLGGGLDGMPEEYASELARQWNAWLKAKHADAASLRRAWSAGEEPLGGELLANGDFAAGLKGWVVEQHGVAKASAEVGKDGPDGQPAAHLAVAMPGAERWHVQLGCPGLAFEHGKSYTLSFWAKADAPRTISVNAAQSHAPWRQLWSSQARLTGQWEQFTFVFSPIETDANSRIVLSNLGGERGEYWFARASLRPGGVLAMKAGEGLGSVAILRKGELASRTAEAQRDWLRFLWQTEQKYWTQMADFLRKDLGCKALVVGTIVGCSTPNLCADMDAVDTHAYWQHPRFPGRPWDPANWTVQNVSMVNEAGGVLPGLAQRRVMGKPHLCTEYNHPAPNTFAGETPLLLAAFAAMQDWDGVFLFSYCHRRDDWDARRIPNFFDIDQHPTKMANLPAAAAMFLRGDLRPADKAVTASLTAEQEVELLRTKGRPWQLVHAGSLGLAGEVALVHRVGLNVKGQPQAAPPPAAALPDSKRFASDTGQFAWDLSARAKGVVTVDTPRTKAVIGFVNGRRFALGDVLIVPGPTRQDWCTIAATVVEGESFAGPGRILLVATGYAENTDMGWKNDQKTTVGRDWGKPPSLVEVVPASVTLPATPNRVTGWALDEHGQRQAQLRLTETDGRATTVHLGPPHHTLWYEIEIRPR